MTRFSASEIHRLREKELQYDRALHLFVYECIRNNPRAERKSVSLHRASRHAVTDIKPLLLLLVKLAPHLLQNLCDIGPGPAFRAEVVDRSQQVARNAVGIPPKA